MSSSPLLKIENLRVRFGHGETAVTAVEDVSFTVHPGRILGIVGESGSGKSVTSLAIMRLLPERVATVTGSVRFGEMDLLTMPDKAMRDMRGSAISMIFQEPMTSLNPAYRIGEQIGEAVRQHRGGSAEAARDRAIEMLRLAGIPAPEQRYNDYPHKLSGGMRQRVMIAMALACDPQLLIADEPTTALDVTIQAQILGLMVDLRDRTNAGIILISHDLGVIAETCDDVVVMYAGQVVETGPVASIFSEPQHPYTLGLLGSLPAAAEPGGRLPVIPGSVPGPSDMPSGCRFRGRCPFEIDRCSEIPPMVVLEPGRTSRCWRAPLEEMM